MRAATEKALAAIEERARSAAVHANQAQGRPSRQGVQEEPPGHVELQALLFVAADRLSGLAVLAGRARRVSAEAPGAARPALRHLALQASLLSLASGALGESGEGPEVRQVGQEIRRLAEECKRLATREF